MLAYRTVVRMCVTQVINLHVIWFAWRGGCRVSWRAHSLRTLYVPSAVRRRDRSSAVPTGHALN